MASTRATSIARRSRSPKPSGRVGCGWAGLPVGASLAASAGASGWVLCVMCGVLPRNRPCVVRLGVGPDRRWTEGRTVVVDVGPTRCTRGINVINPSHPRSCGAGARMPRGLQLPSFSSPVGKGPRAVHMPGSALPPARRRARGHPVTALSERSTEPARRLPAVLRARVGAYVALTKPRIIELLLVTTVPAMMLAARGWPSLSLLLLTLVGGTLAAGAANVFNCYFDRDIDRLMHRTQKRPLPMGVISPRSALIFGARPHGVLDRAAGGDDHAARRGAGGGRDLLLRRPLHDGVQAAHPAQHRVRRRARGGAGADRLGRGDRARWTGRPSWSSASSSAGRCRTSGRWPCGSRPTTRGPTSRCCRW